MVTSRQKTRLCVAWLEGKHWEGGLFHVGKLSTIVKSFVDTNILVYAEDLDAGRKHTAALKLIRELWDDRQGVVSIQVLQEFYVTVTRKLRKPMAAAKALEAVREYLTWTVIDNNGPLLIAAIGVHQQEKLSFWDALIVQAARDAGCDRLYSEDLQPGRRYGGLIVTNPFDNG